MYVVFMPSKTTMLALAEALLAEPLEDWITPRRQLGQSWARLSRELARATAGRCLVTGEFLRRHFGHIPREPKEASSDASLLATRKS